MGPVSGLFYATRVIRKFQRVVDRYGENGAGITLQATNGDFQNQNSGSASGLEMETRISWAALGFTGPSSLGFHIAASNGQNIPISTEDNMDGPGGNGGTINPLPDILTLKSVETLSDPANGTSNPKAIPDAVMQYTITSTNSGFGAADADSVTVTDSIPINTEMFVDDIAGAGRVAGTRTRIRCDIRPGPWFRETSGNPAAGHPRMPRR